MIGTGNLGLILIPCVMNLCLEYAEYAEYAELTYLTSLQEFCTELEGLYEPNHQGHYRISIDDLNCISTALERRAIQKGFGTIWLDDDTTEETAITHTSDRWEVFIINWLISHCDSGALEQISKDDTSFNLEDRGLRDLEDEPAKEERRRKQGEKQAAGNVLLPCCNAMAH